MDIRKIALGSLGRDNGTQVDDNTGCKSLDQQLLLCIDVQSENVLERLDVGGVFNKDNAAIGVVVRQRVKALGY